jgi:hypothetical protein
MKAPLKLKPLSKKVRILLIIAAALLVLGAATGIVLRARARARAMRPITLTLAHDIASQATLEALRTVLGTYSQLYSRTRVVLQKLPARASAESIAAIGADVVVREGIEVAGASPFLEPPVPWTGNLWVLAARKSYLDEAAKRHSAEVAALRAGQAAPDQFEALLADAAGAGLAPITMGNSYGWPFLLWLQHWAAATSGPSANRTIPSPPVVVEDLKPGSPSDPYAALRPAFGQLMAWKKKGWFDKEAWTKGWSAGLAPLVDGKAAFALDSSTHLPYAPRVKLAALEYLAFPKRAEDGPWSVGQATFLGVSATTKETEAARQLVRFLSSPGITTKLVELTGRPFFAWDPKTGKSPTVLPDWSTEGSNYPLDALAKALDPDK